MKGTRRNSSLLGLNFTSIITGTLAALLLTIAGGFLLGAVYHFSGLSESTLPAGGALVIFVSIVCGGALAGKRAGSKGIYHGAGAGILFFVIIWLLAVNFLSGDIEIKSVLLKMLLLLLGGALGGILGIGIRKG